ncbi:unnamed protein product [Cyprideis torosa]|uniref:Uncharacterized protein n=1 Tax=Cyprideis torosa TaxID=163714 RepID=A0A7R8WDV1_9CRUS|nr:unnamed protein product [Cyprideis torosa]CAG0895037.1 unnamed protein product [Cyprideis torosa]
MTKTEHNNLFVSWSWTTRGPHAFCPRCIHSDPLPVLMQKENGLWLSILKGFVFGIIIVAAICGNLLVIVSVCRFRKLRIITNYFLVSLALADTLVSSVPMVFNASVQITGKWIFEPWVCDFWNSTDVFFCTVSILHLCAISVDRFYAIVRPLRYPIVVTKKKVCLMIAGVWTAPILLSFLPIFMKWYTTDEHIQERLQHPDECPFVVNKYYGVISSSVSFWIPCAIMIMTYARIFKEAKRQEEQLMRFRRPSTFTDPGTVHQNPQHGPPIEMNELTVPSSKPRLSISRLSPGPSGDGPSTPMRDSKHHIHKMKSEHKAARTLGIIMGAFIACWFPFFLWYLIDALCDVCVTPDIIVTILFWIGYFNSTLNPIIYAYFNRDFREAFKDTLRQIAYCGHAPKIRKPLPDWTHITLETNGMSRV